MTIQIDKNIPVPDKKSGANCKYPWREMKVGDSFLVPYRSAADANERAYQQSGIINNQKSYRPKRYTSRQQKDGIRVWRIK
jgi:hypothetical protein